ncbi:MULTISPECIES: hypothetical protein [Acinetobacter]|uniref:Uncharacterized protein n=2 Tax=Acinetobacter TaxID=469 RepID=A0A4Q7AY40_9GAMM|nr:MULTISPECIES: hypothetical protein [Acinetobacter]MCW8040182.1 hypothetical protein [Acinetobacter entericus]RZG65535.1 hypothetical protein EXE25_13355 [Acinetobacter bouvetii]TCB77035.1 hypothetical protein E0H91_01885 [Acinetobacter sp. ANC 4177]
MEHIYKFSYDSRNDAISSLAKYYSVTYNNLESKLTEVFQYIDQLKDENLFEDYASNGLMLYQISCMLNSNLSDIEGAKIRISFYHRCSTNGTLEWFKEGLLNNVDGIEAFIRKIEKLEPEIKKINLNLESIKAMSRKKEWDTEKSELVGIHGFYRLRDAKDKTNSGFDIPEILDDYKIYHQIKEKLESTLKSSVVKFYVDRELSEVHGILREYWEFLWNDESIGYAGIDVGKGKTIPFENIERLDDIESL